MENSVNRDRFDEDFFIRETPSGEINYFPIDDMKAALVGLDYALTRVTNFIQNRSSGPSLLDQIGDALFPRL